MLSKLYLRYLDHMFCNSQLHQSMASIHHYLAKGLDHFGIKHIHLKNHWRIVVCFHHNGYTKFRHRLCYMKDNFKWSFHRYHSRLEIESATVIVSYHTGYIVWRKLNNTAHLIHNPNKNFHLHLRNRTNIQRPHYHKLNNHPPLMSNNSLMRYNPHKCHPPEHIVCLQTNDYNLSIKFHQLLSGTQGNLCWIIHTAGIQFDQERGILLPTHHTSHIYLLED